MQHSTRKGRRQVDLDIELAALRTAQKLNARQVARIRKLIDELMRLLSGIH